MTTTFEAHHIAVSDEETFLLVGLADQEFDTQTYMMLQRSYEFDEQDRELGMDTIYIERDDQSQSAYGGIEHISLTPTSVYFSLSAATAHALRSETDLCVSITLTSTELRKLCDGLRQLCAENIPLTIDAAVDRVLTV